MSTSLLGLQIGSSYSGLLKTSDNLVLSAVLRTITDGLGNDSALQISTLGVKSLGTFNAVGAANFGAAVVAVGAVSGSNLSGTNTGDQTNITGNAATATLAVNISGVAAIANGGSGAATAVLARAALNKGEAALADAATVATDASLGNVFTVTLGGNRTLGAPTNLAAGATYLWRITQDGGGSRTLAYNAAFKFPGGLAPVLTTAAGSIDIISGVSNGSVVYCSFIPDVR